MYVAVTLKKNYWKTEIRSVQNKTSNERYVQYVNYSYKNTLVRGHIHKWKFKLKIHVMCFVYFFK